MRAWIVFRKTLNEMRRDLWVVGLTLAFAPVFVILYWLWFYGGSTSYRVLVINHDAGVVEAGGQAWNAGKEAITAIEAVVYADGKPLLVVERSASQVEAEALLRDRKAAAFIEIPANFSATISALKDGGRSSPLTLAYGGDLTNPYYTVAATLALGAVDSYIQRASGLISPFQYRELSLGGSAARSEFEIYVPGVIIFSVILLIFQAAMTAAREIETGALRRLRLTPLTAFDLLVGLSGALVLVGIASVLITFGTAVALGFRSQGPLWVALLLGGLTSLAVIGIGLIVASFARNTAQAFVVANFPLGLLMFFSGVIFPMPPLILFTVAGRAISLYDILPPTHAVAALNKILTLGAGPSEVLYELGMLVSLSALYFGIGVIIFQRMQMR
jgi:ABC-2 type transport system permease protein